MNENWAFGLGGMESEDYSGDPMTATAVGIPSVGYEQASMPGDASDDQAMRGWNPAGASSAAPWWAAGAMYGFTRAIDNQFPRSPTGTTGNTYPGSGAGASGRTYSIRPSGAGGGIASARANTPLGRINMQSSPDMFWLGLGIVVLMLVKK